VNSSRRSSSFLPFLLSPSIGWNGVSQAHQNGPLPPPPIGFPIVVAAGKGFARFLPPLSPNRTSASASLLPFFSVPISAPFFSFFFSPIKTPGRAVKHMFCGFFPSSFVPTPGKQCSSFPSCSCGRRKDLANSLDFYPFFPLPIKTTDGRYYVLICRSPPPFFFVGKLEDRDL